jgi:hypothetical protein
MSPVEALSSGGQNASFRSWSRLRASLLGQAQVALAGLDQKRSSNVDLSKWEPRKTELEGRVGSAAALQGSGLRFRLTSHPDCAGMRAVAPDPDETEVLQLCSHPVVGWRNAPPGVYGCGLFKWRQLAGGHPPGARLVFVGFSLRYRDVEELLPERGFSVDHVTVCRGGPAVRPRVGSAPAQTAEGNKRLWRADSTGATIDFLLSETCARSPATKRFI